MFATGIILVILYVNDASGAVEAITSRYDLDAKACELEKQRVESQKPHKPGIHLSVQCTDTEPDIETLKRPLHES